MHPLGPLAVRQTYKVGPIMDIPGTHQIIRVVDCVYTTVPVGIVTQTRKLKKKLQYSVMCSLGESYATCRHYVATSQSYGPAGF